MLKKVIMLLVLLTMVSYSMTIALENTKTTLISEVTVNNDNFTDKEGTIQIKASVTNSKNFPRILYIGEVFEDEIEVIKPLGAIDANTKTYTTINLKTNYNDETIRNRTFVLLLNKDQEDNKFPVKFFNVKEDWGEYKNKVTEMLIHSNVVTIPIIAIIIILLLTLLSQAVSAKPFQVKYLFFPKFKTIYEEIANVLFNPLTWLIEIVLIIIMGGIINYYYGNAPNMDSWFQIFIISSVGAIFFPIIYLSFAWFIEKSKEFKPLKFFWGLFLYGAIAAYFAFLINTFIIQQTNSMELGEITYLLITAVIIAPIIEELVKLSGLFITSMHSQYNDAITGLMFGFTVGVGFSFIENWFYFASRTDPFTLGFVPWVQLIIYRSIFNSLAHGIVTGVGGAIIGHVKSLSNNKGMIILSWIIAFLLSVPLHSMFNVSAILDGSVTGEAIFGLPVMFNPLIVVFLILVFIITYIVTFKDKSKVKV